MDTFGKRLLSCRKAKDLSQKELAKLLNTSHTVIGKYERDEMIPSIEAAKKLSKILDVTVGYLVGENEDSELFKDTQMLERFKELNKLPDKDKNGILYALDGLLRDAKTRKAYSK